MGSAAEAARDILTPLDTPTQGAPITVAAPLKQRINSVDLLRGLIMVIMLLDHTRDFVHHDTFFFDPTDLTRTNPALFYTRWVTHFCAPLFVFLSGAGAYFQLARGKPKAELSKFLVTRGLWLIVLEFTVVRFLVFWNLDYQFLGMAQVIWVLGVSMILLAGLIHLPIRAIAAFGIAMILVHNAFDSVRVTPWQGPGTPIPTGLGALWMVLHQQGVLLPFGFPRTDLVHSVSAHPMARRDGNGIRLRIDLRSASGGTTSVASSVGSDRDGRIHRDPRHESVWRSIGLGRSEISGDDRAVLPESSEVSAVTPVSDDDDWSGTSRAGMVGPIQPADHRGPESDYARAHHLRSRAALLLFAAMGDGTQPRLSAVTCRRQAYRYLLQASRTWHERARECWIQPGRRIRGLDYRRRPSVSAVSLVLGSEGTPSRLVAQLPLRLRVTRLG
jgi:hypothetical protein